MFTGNKVLPEIQPWERVTWNSEQLQSMYCKWGKFFSRSQLPNIASIYYDKTLELNESDFRALYERAKCKRTKAQTATALKDCKLAEELAPSSALPSVLFEYCDTLFESNDFESAASMVNDNVRNYEGIKKDAFVFRTNILEGTFEDTLGPSLTPFVNANAQLFGEVRKEADRKNFVDTRQLWKKLRDADKCDVLSILEKEEILLSPREIARRQRATNVFFQIYFNKNWTDVMFLKALRDSPTLLLKQSLESTPILQNLIQSRYKVIKNFLKMLHARSPMYNEIYHKYTNKQAWEYFRECHLNRIQYQTRRNMITILRGIKQLRESGEIEKLTNYIETVMGDYIVLKTHRIMPWKFEFINEVYNTLALAHADSYTVPDDIMQIKRADRLMILFHVPISKERNVKFVFNDKSTYQVADAPDLVLIAYKRYLARLEKRMHFAKYSIEKCYLFFEIARMHVRQAHFDEGCAIARKAMDEAKLSNNTLWQFLASLLICQSYITNKKVERAKEALKRSYKIAHQLRSVELCNFVDVCTTINELDLSKKKDHQSTDSIRKRRSKYSISSRMSVLSSSQSKESKDYSSYKADVSSIEVAAS